MAVLVTCQKLGKSYRSRPLFQNLSVSFDEGDRTGVVGPNGAGKSTFMKILAGQVEADEGSLTMKKDLRVALLAQEDQFAEAEAGQVLQNAIACLKLEEHEANNRVEKQLSQFGFTGPQQEVSTLSGGWRKRLSLARELIKEPDLLLLDEPTNHLDLDGVIWLEKLLKQARFSFMLVTHDRQFLENVSTRMFEINPGYEDGCLAVKGTYSDFLLARQEYFKAQANLEQALASKVRREIAWLQRGARARQTKSSARIKDAGELIDSLSEVRERNAANVRIDVDFDSTGRRSKELLVAKGLGKEMGGRRLFSNLDLILRPGTRIGLIGANGSGKSTLLRILAGQLVQEAGQIKRRDGLRVVWFDQNREALDQSQSLREALCPEGDTVTYRDRTIHVSTWARRFLFKIDQLNMPISYLSGGEQARILIANLMKQPADILLLDEPTNDLDLPSLEVLEDSLLEFPGAIVLVTHDRYMIHQVPTMILSLDGQGGSEYFADYSQWESAVEEKEKEEEKPAKEKQSRPEADKERLRGLSTSEKKELLEIAGRIENAEEIVQQLQQKMAEPDIACNHEKLIQLQSELDEAQKTVEKLYRRWEDLELRQAAAARASQKGE
jgi:ABC transport system ATP-binding/permease protein